jgi:hypothetical protein
VFKFTKITYIYWPIKCTSKPSFAGMFEVETIPTSIGQLNALKYL